MKNKNELVQKFKGSSYVQRVVEVADRLTQKLSEIQSIVDRSQVRALKKKLKSDLREWKQVLKSKPQEWISDSPSHPC